MIEKSNTTNITLGPPILEKWLRSHYTIHHSDEIIITTDPTNTIMTIMIKGEDYPKLEE